MMNKKLIVASISLVFLTMGSMVVTAQIENIIGHSFTEDQWAVEVDLNGQSFWDTLDTTAANWKVVNDVSGLPNAQLAADTDDFDQQFYMAFNNFSGIETAYVALEKISGELIIDTSDVPVLGNFISEIDLGMVNATAPFQTLIQHWKAFDYEMFIANTFNAFVAYSTTPDDMTLDGGDDVYLGYTLVADILLDAINSQRGGTYDPNNVLPVIPDFNAVPIWNVINDHELEIGIEYSNLFTFWQHSKPSITASYGGLDYTIDTRGVLYDFHAATLFPKITFKYKLYTEVIDDIVYGRVKFEYDLDPISLMFTKDDTASYGNLVTEGVCNDTNSFNVPTQTLDFSASGADFAVDIGSFSVFEGVAARNRIEARGTELYQQGYGISAAYTTNSFELGYTLEVPSPIAGAGATMSYPIQIGGETVFETDFTEAPNYELTLENGTVDEYPLYVEYMNPASVFNGPVVRPYFDLQGAMTGTFLGWTAYNLSPMLAATLANPYSSIAQIHMDVDQAHSVWFLECGKWNGLKINMDPTFSAVAAVQSSDTSTSGDPTGEDTTGIGIPGFELVALVAFPAYITFKKRK